MKLINNDDEEKPSINSQVFSDVDERGKFNDFNIKV